MSDEEETDGWSYIGGPDDFDDPRDWEYQLVEIECANENCKEKFHSMVMHARDRVCEKCEEKESEN